MALYQVKEVCDCNKIPTANVSTRRTLIRKITESIDAAIEREEEYVTKHYLCSMFSFMEAQGENEDEENGRSNKMETDSSRIEQDVVNEADSQQNLSELQIGNMKMRDKMGKIKVKGGEKGKKSASRTRIYWHGP